MLRLSALSACVSLLSGVGVVGTSSTCIQAAGQADETRSRSAIGCLGGDVHLEMESLAVGFGSNGCIGSAARYGHVNGTSWNSEPLGVIVDHDLDGMQSNFKGDFFTRTELSGWAHREG